MSTLLASVFCVATVPGAHLSIAHYSLTDGTMISATAVTATDDYSAHSDSSIVKVGRWTVSYNAASRQVIVNNKKISSVCK